MAKLKLYKSTKPKGHLIRVANLGVFENGNTYDIPGNEDIVIGEEQTAPVVSSPETGLSSGEKPEEEDS